MRENVVEEVDNSQMAQATRVISHTSIREKIDPADIDIRATDADRKAADKNIIIQLRKIFKIWKNKLVDKTRQVLSF